MFLLFLIFSLLLSCNPVLANTEIVNFGVNEDHLPLTIPASETWPVLRPDNSETRWEIRPAELGTYLQSICEPLHEACPHESWFALDLDAPAWEGYDKFTFRISYAAFNPADFQINIYTPPEATRRKYARIRAVDTGVLTPKPGYLSTTDAALPDSGLIPIIIVLEPLLLGAVPASLAPVIGFLAFLVACGIGATRVAWPYLSALAAQARRELSDSVQQEDKKHQ